MFIKSIESRILTGILMFVATMILIGWVSINEEARMQAFVQQHTGRSIERGAELFASLCASAMAKRVMAPAIARLASTIHTFLV